MINFRVVARVFSLVLILEGIFMLLSAGVSFICRDDTTSSIFFSAIITIVTGVLVFTPLRNEEKLSENKEGYVILTGIWILLSMFGTLPYLLSGTIKGFGNAFFESMSGFTTTGATILKDIDYMPQGILFWRSLTQWIGGLGFILISLSILPVVRSINVQFSISDFTAQTTNKIHPRVKEAAKRLGTIYFMLTLSETILLFISGMPFFDAVCHSMSTISTGGFSTRTNGIAAFNSPYILIIITLFMFLAGTNLTLIYFGLKRNFKKITGNSEFIFYAITCIVTVLIASVYLWSEKIFPAGRSFIEGAFNTVSVITTTGFYHSDWNTWGYFLSLMIFILMFTGGTSGSPSGSLKAIRLLMAAKNARHEMKKMIHPNAVIPVRLDNETVPKSLVYNLIVFMTLYFLVTCVSSLIVSLMGYDTVTSFSTSAAMLGNIGPALGTFGPFTNYSELPAAGKWFFSFLMLIGRIELFSVLILFSPEFYRR